MRRSATGCVRVGAALLLTALTAFVLYPLTFVSLSLARRAVRHWARAILWMLGCRVEVIGDENLRKRGFILAAQHTSLIDTFLFPAILPSRTIYFGKSELGSLPLVGRLYRRLGYHLVDRASGPSSLKLLARQAATFPRDAVVFVHPQGTRRNDVLIGPLKPGVAALAIGSGLPIVPALLEGGCALWPKGRIFPRPGCVRVSFLPEIPAEAVKASELRSLTARVRDVMEHGSRNATIRGL